MNKTPDQFTKEEAERRLKAALHGARIAGHKPLSEKPKAKKADNRPVAPKKPG
jgi:hypothetical protein